MLFYQVQGLVIDGFGDDLQAVALADLGKNLQPLEAQALKGIRRGARLISARAEEADTGAMHALRNGKRLLPALNRAGAGNDGQFSSADAYLAALWGREAYDRVVLLHITAHQLVRLADLDDLLHSGHLFQPDFHQALVAGNADSGSLRSGNAVRPQPVRLNLFAYGAYLFFRGLRLHHN